MHVKRALVLRAHNVPLVVPMELVDQHMIEHHHWGLAPAPLELLKQMVLATLSVFLINMAKEDRCAILNVHIIHTLFIIMPKLPSHRKEHNLIPVRLPIVLNTPTCFLLPKLVKEYKFKDLVI